MRRGTFLYRCFLTLLLLSLVTLTGCGGSNSSSNTTPSNGRQMGGAIQGSALRLSGTVSSLAGPLPTNTTITGVATDGANLYLSDRGDHTIKKMVIATGETTVLAGTTGTAGYADGTGSSARFNWPTDVACDGVNLYVSEAYNHALRKIVIATGEVSTLAGSAATFGSTDGIGSAARFNTVRRLTTDGTNLFLVDADAVRKVVIATGEVTTVAGDVYLSGSNDGIGPAARFYVPSGIATDGTYVYVADGGNDTLRKVLLATGEVTTVAGSVGVSGSADGIGSAARFGTMTGISTDGTNVFVTDGRGTIRRVVIATGAVTTVAGTANQSSGMTDGIGAAAKFFYPRAITSHGGLLYVTDDNGTAIRKIIAATGAVSTINPSGGWMGAFDGTGTAARFHLPMAITTDGTNVYVADSSNRTIRKVSLASGTVSTLAGSATSPAGLADGTGAAALFNNPCGITTDGVNLYVTDQGNLTIRKIEIATGKVTTPYGTFASPTGITTDGTHLFITDLSAIVMIDISTGERRTLAGDYLNHGSSDGTGAAARFYWPRAITTDGSNLYVGDTYNHTIRKVVIATGEVTTIAGSASEAGAADGTGAAARFDSPYGITTDGTSLYVTDVGTSYSTRKVALATGAVTTIAPSLTGKTWAGVTTDGKRLFVTTISGIRVIQ